MKTEDVARLLEAVRNEARKGAVGDVADVLYGLACEGRLSDDVRNQIVERLDLEFPGWREAGERLPIGSIGPSALTNERR